MSNSLIFLLKKVEWPKRLMIFSVFLTIFSSIIALFIPIISKKLIDNFDFNVINYLFILVFIILFIFSSCLDGISLYLLSKIGEKTIYSIREQLWTHLVKLDLSFFDKNKTGELMSRITEDTSVINSFISERAPTSINSVLILIGSIIFLFILDWKLTLLAFIIIPIFILILIPLSKIIGSLSEETQNQIAKFNNVLAKSLYNIRLVKASASENLEIENAKKNLGAIYTLGLKESKIRAILSPISSVIMMITVIIILGYGGVRVSQDQMTAGTLVAMIFYIVQLSEPILNLSLFFTDYHESVGASKRIFDIYHEKKEDYNKKNEDFSRSGSIEFKNVSFSYDDQSLVLKNISFKINEGEFTAIVGPSGSGKTTILNLIERFYTPKAGEILYSNENINNYNLQKWRNHVGLVMQNNTIVPGTIKENIMYGIDRNVGDEEVINAAQSAYCHDFIISLPDGYNTYVGEQGIKLSGGQKQRIEIARIFLKQSSILIFDEATANLDSESEQKVQNSVDILTHSKTVLVVAHRLSTIRKADKILFLDKGVITGCASHKELIRTHSKYNDFVKGQNILE